MPINGNVDQDERICQLHKNKNYNSGLLSLKYNIDGEPTKKLVLDLQNWTRGQLIHDGSSGRIFQAIDNETQETFAVKSTPLCDNIALRLLINERKTLSKLSRCPNIVHFLGTSSTEIRSPWNGYGREANNKPITLANVFLEYLPKGSLFQLLKSSKGNKLSPGVSKSYTRDILHALTYIHGMGVVHGNINASNVLVDERSVRLCDFTLSHHVKACIPPWMDDCLQSLKPEYKVPEQFVRDKIMYVFSSAIDIFSLGSLVCEMITGKRARLHFHRDHQVRLFEELEEVLRSLVVEIPKEGWQGNSWARDFVAKCLIKDPKSRWTAEKLRKHPWITNIDNLRVVVNMNSVDTMILGPHD